MQTALDTPSEKLNPHEQKFVASIREHGWHRTSVIGDEETPGFSYTTGLWLKLGFPEIIVFSLPNETAGDVLWDIDCAVQEGRVPSVGVRCDALLGNAPGFLFPVGKQHYAEHLGWSRWFYGGDDFPSPQLVWPDKAGLFPWEAGADPEFASCQPDLSPAGWTEALSRP